MPWYVLKVAPRQELATEKQIKDLGLEAMCPYAKSQRWVRGNRRDWMFPLFTGYLFAAWAPFQAGWHRLSNEIDGVKSIRGILRREDGEKEPAVLRPADVEYLKSIADGKYTLPEELRSLRVGDQVLIPEGPFEGYLAVLKKISGKEATLEPKAVRNKYRLRIPLAKLRRA